jgi:hypothetical protein
VAEKSPKNAGKKSKRRTSPAADNSRRVETVPKGSPDYSQTFVMRLNPQFKEWPTRFANSDLSQSDDHQRVGRHAG